MARKTAKKTIKLKVAAILDIFPLSNHWWANVDCIGPLGHYSKNLAFETEAEARGCIGLVFKVVC